MENIQIEYVRNDRDSYFDKTYIWSKILSSEISDLKIAALGFWKDR